jgi:hypothetical protein
VVAPRKGLEGLADGLAALMHRSAWKVNSGNFARTGF